jgi:hypothetical protein
LHNDIRLTGNVFRHELGEQMAIRIVHVSGLGAGYNGYGFTGVLRHVSHTRRNNREA